MAPGIVADVGDDSDDGGPRFGGTVVAGFDAMAEGVTPWPEALGQRFADDGNRSGVDGIPVSEIASFDDGEMQEPEKIRTDTIVVGGLKFAALHRAVFDAEGV